MTAAKAQLAAAMAALTDARTAQMVDTCTVTRPNGRQQTPTLGPDGKAPRGGATVYIGRCTVSDPTKTTAVTVTDDTGVPNLRVLKVPHSADLHTGDVVTVTDSAFSPGLIGDQFTVVSEDERSYATCRRYNLRGSSWQSTESGT